MTFLHAFLFGAVQGLTEFLPVSSSSHLVLLPRVLGIEDPGLAFDVFLHAGTLAAILLFFRQDWWAVWKNFRGSDATTQANGSVIVSWKLILAATIPALLAGGLLHKVAETSFRGNGVIIGAQIVGGLCLVLADRLSKSTRTLADMKIRDAITIGVIQTLALIPGFSRAGSTLIGGRIQGFKRIDAARFSFLIAAPVTAAAVLFELRHFHELAENTVGVGPMILAGLTSFVFGWLAIGGFLRLLRNFGFMSFAIYRLLLAFAIWKFMGV